MTDFEILIGKGLKKLSFGDRLDDIRIVLGEPDEIEENQYADESLSKELRFNDLDILLTLSSEDDYRLTDILIFNSKFHINGQIRVGISKSLALDLATKFDFGDFVFEDLRSEENPTHELAMFDKVSLLLWFDNDLLSSIQFGPLWIDDDTIKWPE